MNYYYYITFTDTVDLFKHTYVAINIRYLYRNVFDLLLVELLCYEIWIQRNVFELLQVQRCALKPGHLLQHGLLQLGHRTRGNVVSCIYLHRYHIHCSSNLKIAIQSV